MKQGQLNINHKKRSSLSSARSSKSSKSAKHSQGSSSARSYRGQSPSPSSANSTKHRSSSSRRFKRSSQRSAAKSLFPSLQSYRKAQKRTQHCLEEWQHHGSPSPRSGPSSEAPSTDQNSPTLLDPWQQQGVQALQQGKHVVVDAPTTAGKTRIVEAYLSHKLNHDSTFRACYTCPVKSLANDKLHEMRHIFGPQNVGINTGDVKSQLDAPLIVATLESYRNSLLGRESPFLADLVIFDEYHYIQDYTRGSSWEEAIILSHRKSQLLLLSASIANAHDFRTWMETIHSHSTVLVQTTKRPVPLKSLVFDPYHRDLVVDHTLPESLALPSSSTSSAAASPTQNDQIPFSVIIATLQQADQRHLTPCIVYCGTRGGCERLAIILARRMSSLNSPQQQQLAKAFDHALKEHQAESLCSTPYKRLVIQHGITYHHSGLAPPLRVAVESLVKQGMLRICVATSGLSLGINFSVKSTLIADYQRPGDQGFQSYSSSEILQMLGRAGRRGRDAVGYSLWPLLSQYQLMAGAQREAIYPKLRYDPTTLLGLLDKGHALPTIQDLYERSFEVQRHRDKYVTLISTENLHHVLFKRDPQDYKDHSSNTDPSLPCDGSSPLREFLRYKRDATGSTCRGCKHLRPCHRYQKATLASDRLAKLHAHLHTIGALNPDNSLSAFGKIAQHFPQPGGLYIARLIQNGWTESRSISKLAEVMASFCVAHHKSLMVPADYRLPIALASYRKALAKLYPHDLFSHLYEHTAQTTTPPTLIESHPGAGYIIQQWIFEDSWDTFESSFTHRYYAVGDLFSLIYKVANFLQSLAKASQGRLSQDAKSLRQHLLRAPLDAIELIK